METTATILHADLDAFYASVEQLLDPSLRGKPVAVGGGVVLAASYEAKHTRVRRGMSGWRARELCPQLIFVGGHFGDYQRLGDAAVKVLNNFTPLVERISIDEAFGDVAGCTHHCVRPGFQPSCDCIEQRHRCLRYLSRAGCPEIAGRIFRRPLEIGERVLLLRIRSHHLLDALHRQTREASSRLLITERCQIAAQGRRTGLAFPLCRNCPSC